MQNPRLEFEAEFNLMVLYQIAIESRSVIVENSQDDEFAYSLFEVVAPFPSYQDFLACDEFEEGILLAETSDIASLQRMQERRRKCLKAPAMIDSLLESIL